MAQTILVGSDFTTNDIQDRTSDLELPTVTCISDPPQETPSPSSPSTPIYQATVIGAGAGGIAAVGALLERDIAPIHWIDDAFSAGRINTHYREVPSNTKVRLILDFATSVPAFREIWASLPAPDNALTILSGFDPESECPLSHAADLLLQLTSGLRGLPQVHSTRARVESVNLYRDPQVWTVALAPSPPVTSRSSVRARRVMLCTGSFPAVPALPRSLARDAPRIIPLDTALSPSLLSCLLSTAGAPQTVSVVGASHSAVLVLKNLVELAAAFSPSLRIYWLSRRALWFAEADPETGRYVARDNSGLKGVAARWARDNLENLAIAGEMAGEGRVMAVRYEPEREEEVWGEYFGRSGGVVFAVGYTANELPEVREGKRRVKARFDHGEGGFVDEKGREVPGLHGVGVAFAEGVLEGKYGYGEMNIGFMGFMKAARRWFGGWGVME